jgi:uncharacterized protein
MTVIEWDAGTWTTEPEGLRADGHDLVVTARSGSDFWRTTSYGFVHDDGHGLLVDLPDGLAVEVSWLVDYSEQFDQAGVLVRADPEHWVKAGVEHADGRPQLGAVATDRRSDWSLAPVPEWQGRVVTVRASRRGDALTVRARTDGPWQLVRVAPLDPTLAWRAGPMVCAPTRAGLTVRFTGFTLGTGDGWLH